jgi:hypothetical protein
VQRIGEGCRHLEAGRAQFAAPRHPDLGAPAYLADPLAQRDQVVIWRSEDRDSEELVLGPAVTGRPLQARVAQAVASAADDQ